jgi:hypothetical protein
MTQEMNEPIGRQLLVPFALACCEKEQGSRISFLFARPLAHRVTARVYICGFDVF